MPVPTSITDLSTTASSNYPGGTDSVAANTGPDDYFRAHASIIRRLQAKGANVASAATVDLGAIADGSYVHITGTTGITSFGTVAAGVSRTVVFDGALTITHNATSMILPGAANITTAAGDVAEFVSEGSGNWRCKTYQSTPIYATLTALAGTLTAANKIPYATGVDTAGELDFKDEDNMASDSATAVPSQQSVKAYADTKNIATQVTPGTSGNVLTSNGTAWVSSAPSGSDAYTAKVSSNDTTPGYLNGKLVAGTNITFTENNNGANETLTIAASGGVSTDVGAGGVGMMAEMLNSGAGNVASGASTSGAYLRFTLSGSDSGVAPSGTWRNITGTTVSAGYFGAFQRIA